MIDYGKLSHTEKLSERGRLLREIEALGTAREELLSELAQVQYAIENDRFGQEEDAA